MKTCPYAEKCGGCAFINKPYEESLKIKQSEVFRLFDGYKVDPIKAMEDPYHYRHKVYAAFGMTKTGKIFPALYEESTHKMVNSHMCLIQHTAANRILQTIASLCDSMHIQPYDERSGRGVLRHAYIRISHASGDVLLVLVIGSKQLPSSGNFVKAIVREHPEIKTIILNRNSEHTSMVLGGRDTVLYGKGYITDKIGDIEFRISARSFYQVNPQMTEVIYQTALEMADLKATDTVLDACCGTGTISLLAAGKAGYVLGVELNEDAVQDAVRNAENNGIENVDFIVDDVTSFIDDLEDTPDAVFLDPPRTGLSSHFMQAIAQLGPSRIVYVSCNPETQRRDINILLENGYRIRRVQPADNFPFTRSIENIVLLVRQNQEKSIKPPVRRPARQGRPQAGRKGSR